MTLSRSKAGLLPATFGAIAGTLMLGACGDDSVSFPGGDDEIVCSIPRSDILSGQRKDGIPALTNPEMARVGESGTEYLRDDDRVIGILLDGEPIAIPLNIMWWHEIVNLDGAGGSSVAVSHCPLTGSSLAFDRSRVDDSEFGVSGLLFNTNLIMYDRSGATESLWPQMLRGARCGPSDGAQLQMVSIVEVTWAGWQWLYPTTRVVTSNTDYSRDYRSYPYGVYDRTANDDLYFPLQTSMDRRRPPKERVLGVPDGSGGLTFPFGELDELGAVAVVEGSTSTEDFVVLWEREREGAMAYRPVAGGLALTLSVVNGVIMDAETGSTWRMDGVATAGPLDGLSLDPVDEAFVAFWFAWPAFYPDVEIWETDQ